MNKRLAWLAALMFQASVAGAVSAEELIPFDAPAGTAIFAHAQANASAWELLRFYETQSDTAFCGVASSVIVLNSLGITAPISPEIYPYRMFNQANFFTDKVLLIKTQKAVSMEGLELEQLAAMLGTFGVKVDVHHADQLGSVDEFRRVASAALADPGKRVIVNYLRRSLGQEGGGHHSPLAAYDAQTDRFLILDVARYRLPPVWVTASDLWAAIDTIDNDAQKKRGLLVISR
ncbi:MAG: phytochelatin synthase family protein [Methylobacteriaceae bacterium]|nr:phytochelatin synthase family protein [Methylobacteriaceae bacterium]